MTKRSGAPQLVLMAILILIGLATVVEAQQGRSPLEFM